MHVLLVMMKYDYGIKERGLSNGHYNWTLCLEEMGVEVAGFSVYSPYAAVRHWLLSDLPVESQFETFVGRVADAIGTSYLPVYRMADGEFSFLLHPRPSKNNAKIPIKQRIGEYVNYVLHVTRMRYPSTCWGENYSNNDLESLKHSMMDAVRQVATDGILALYFAIREDHWGEQYFRPMCSLLDKSQIEITMHNYVPFYFVYALLNGPARERILAGRRILVVTHLTPKRTEAISAGLRSEKGVSVHFLGISANHSMTDVLDLSNLRSRIDLVLVAAGIGSVNVLR